MVVDAQVALQKRFLCWASVCLMVLANPLFCILMYFIGVLHLRCSLVSISGMFISACRVFMFVQPGKPATNTLSALFCSVSSVVLFLEDVVARQGAAYSKIDRMAWM